MLFTDFDHYQVENMFFILQVKCGPDEPQPVVLLWPEDILMRIFQVWFKQS